MWPTWTTEWSWTIPSRIRPPRAGSKGLVPVSRGDRRLCEVVSLGPVGRYVERRHRDAELGLPNRFDQRGHARCAAPASVGLPSAEQAENEDAVYEREHPVVHHEERDHKELPHPRDAHLRIRAHHAEHVERADDYVLAPVQEQDDKDRPVMGKDPDQGDGVDEEERDDGGRPTRWGPGSGGGHAR